MSVIAVKVTNSDITVACDSMLSKEGLKRTNYSKVRSHNNMIVGGCGSATELELFFEFTKTNQLASLDTLGVMHYMRKFADFKERITHEDGIDNNYIIVYADTCFEVDGFFVKKVTDYTACGDGESYALAALYLNHSVEEAVEAACAFCTSAAPPIYSFRMKDRTVYIK